MQRCRCRSAISLRNRRWDRWRTRLPGGRKCVSVGRQALVSTKHVVHGDELKAKPSVWESLRPHNCQVRDGNRQRHSSSHHQEGQSEGSRSRTAGEAVKQNACARARERLFHEGECHLHGIPQVKVRGVGDVYPEPLNIAREFGLNAEGHGDDVRHLHCPQRNVIHRRPDGPDEQPRAMHHFRGGGVEGGGGQGVVNCASGQGIQPMNEGRTSSLGSLART